MNGIVQINQSESVAGALLCALLLLGLGGDTRAPDCPDPGILIRPSTTAEALIRVIEPPRNVDPGMARPRKSPCLAALPTSPKRTEEGK